MSATQNPIPNTPPPPRTTDHGPRTSRPLTPTDVDCLIVEAATLAREEPVRALVLAVEARTAAEFLGSDVPLVRALIVEADAHYFGGQPGYIAQVEVVAERARRLAIDLADPELEIAALARLTRAVDLRGDHAAALIHSRRRIDLARILHHETGQVVSLAESLSSEAALYLNREDCLGAAPLLMDALRLVLQAPHCEPGSPEAERLDKIEAIILSNMAIIQGAAGQHEAAAATLADVAQRHGRRNDQPPRIKALGNFVDECLILGRYAQAEAACEEAITAIEQSGIRQSEPVLRLRQSRVLRQQGRYDEAEFAILQGREQAERTGNRRHLARLIAEQGLIVAARGNQGVALRLLEEALAISEALNRPADRVDICGYLAEVAEAQGDLALALHYSKAHREGSQRLHQTAAERRLAIGLAELQVEQAEQEAQDARKEAEDLRHLARNLEDMAVRDPLTGVYNRRFLDRWLADRLERASRFNAPFSIALIDLDNFKTINDRFSHEMGDYVLRIAARVMNECIRPEDVFARYGGEEFVLVLPGASKRDAHTVCERLRTALLAYPWREAHSELSVTASIGIADRSDADLLSVLFSIADERLYEAKSAGKNGVVSEAVVSRQ